MIQFGPASKFAWRSDAHQHFILTAHGLSITARFAGPITLRSHVFLEASHVDLQTFILSIFVGHFNWEAIGVKEFKRICSRNFFLTVLFQVSNDLIEQGHAGVQSLAEACFFRFNDLLNKLLVGQNLWVITLHDLTNNRH